MHLWSRCLLFQSLEIVKLGQFKYNSFSSKLFLFMTTGLNCSQMWRSKLFRSKQIYHLQKVRTYDGFKMAHFNDCAREGINLEIYGWLTL